jgi:hypothetical protein
MTLQNALRDGEQKAFYTFSVLYILGYFIV